MTDKKKTGKTGITAKKKLQVSKETLKDLSAIDKAQQVRGGAPNVTRLNCPWCTGGYTDNA